MSAHERERLSAYLDGELPASERAEVETHLATCAECTALLAALGEVDEVGRELPVEAPSGYFDSFAGRVRARIAEEGAPRTRAAPPRARRRLPAWTWAAAAALLLAVVTPMTMSRLMRAPMPASDAPLAHAPAGPARPQAAETLPERMVTATRDDEADTAAQGKREAGGARSDRGYRAVEPEPPFAPPPPPPPAVAAPRPPLGAGKRDADAESPPPPAAESRPQELQKDSPSLAADLSEGEALEEAPAAGAAGRQGAMADAMPSRATPDRVLGRTASAPKARVATSSAPAAPVAALEAESGTEIAAVEKKVVVSEDALAFAELTRGVPTDAPAWRERREAWRAFIAEHPQSPHVDEAWARMVEAGLEAWSAGGEPGDFTRARADAAAYLNREAAPQKERIRGLMEDAESR